MEKRQIVIFVLTGLVILYGAFTYLVEPLLETKTPKALDAKKLAEQTEVIKASVDKNEPDKLELYRIARAERGVETDPFLENTPEPEAQQTEAEAQAAKAVTFKYAGYVEMGQTRLAIINGLDYMIGEELAETGYFLVGINRTRVVIEKRGEDDVVLEQMNVPLQDDFSAVPKEKDDNATDAQ